MQSPDGLPGLSGKCLVLRDEPLKKHTTFRIGGNAAMLAVPYAVPDIKAILRMCKEKNLAHFIIGNGSNVLAADGGFDGVVIKLAGTLDEIKTEGRELVCGAGALIPGLYRACLAAGLSGIEYFPGIPAAAGGAAAMNMGSFGRDFSGLIDEVYAISPDGTERTVAVKDIGFGYKRSSLAEEGYVITGLKLKLMKDDPENIKSKYMDCLSQKKKTQPLKAASAGCIFKNPPGDAAGYLIEKSGLKGFRSGAASVSTKHANYIVNEGGASAADVMTLINVITRKVFRDSGVCLEPEIRLLGF